MKCTIIFGSPRKTGNTASLLGPFMDELKHLGAEIDFFDVYDMDIKGCRVCLKCQEDKNKLYCSIKDDMAPIPTAPPFWAKKEWPFLPPADIPWKKGRISTKR